MALFVRRLMHFSKLPHIKPKLGKEVGDRSPKFVRSLMKRPHQRSKVIHRSMYLRYATWLPNLVGAVHIVGVKGHTGVIWVNQVSNCLEMLFGHESWLEEPLTRPKCIAGSKVAHESSDYQIRSEKNPTRL